jgi:hypothetical protein
MRLNEVISTTAFLRSAPDHTRWFIDGESKHFTCAVSRCDVCARQTRVTVNSPSLSVTSSAWPSWLGSPTACSKRESTNAVVDVSAGDIHTSKRRIRSQRSISTTWKVSKHFSFDSPSSCSAPPSLRSTGIECLLAFFEKTKNHSLSFTRSACEVQNAARTNQ